VSQSFSSRSQPPPLRNGDPLIQVSPSLQPHRRSATPPLRHFLLLQSQRLCPLHSPHSLSSLLNSAPRTQTPRALLGGMANVTLCPKRREGVDSTAPSSMTIKKTRIPPSPPPHPLPKELLPLTPIAQPQPTLHLIHVSLSLISSLIKRSCSTQRLVRSMRPRGWRRRRCSGESTSGSSTNERLHSASLPSSSSFLASRVSRQRVVSGQLLR
jgi:hypothetical protein